jgi:chromosomal replication initiator protein
VLHRPAARSPRAAETNPFLVLPENQQAFSAAMQLRDAQPSRPAPVLTITGPAGSGKSHLVSQVFSERRVAGRLPCLVEVTADEFVAECMEAVRTRRVAAMRELYLAHETLVCEDLQSFRSSAAAQEAFVSLMDELLCNGGRVVVTGPAALQELRGLTLRLVNRCHGGVSVGIQLPGRSSRLKLLQHFAAPIQVPVAIAALEALAETEGQSPRELRGRLRRLLQAAELQRGAIDLALLRTLLAEEPAHEPRRVADVAREVARQFGVTLRELRSTSRVAPARLPRQAAMYLSREVTTAPCAEIGAYFNGRSHSTVVYACERYEQQLAEDTRLMALTNSIRQVLVQQGRRNRVNNRPAKRRASG